MNKINTSDLDFNFTPHPLTGDVNIKTNIDAIKQSLKNILMTSLLDRPFNTNLFLNLKSYLFENFDIYYEDKLRRDIENIITFYEKRVKINNLNVSFDEDNLTLGIILDFSLIYDSSINSQLELIVERTR